MPTNQRLHFSIRDVLWLMVVVRWHAGGGDKLPGVGQTSTRSRSGSPGLEREPVGSGSS